VLLGADPFRRPTAGRARRSRQGSIPHRPRIDFRCISHSGQASGTGGHEPPIARKSSPGRPNRASAETAKPLKDKKWPRDYKPAIGSEQCAEEEQPSLWAAIFKRKYRPPPATHDDDEAAIASASGSQGARPPEAIYRMPESARLANPPDADVRLGSAVRVGVRVGTRPRRARCARGH